MSRLSWLHSDFRGIRQLAPVWLLASGCHLVVSPSGDDPTDSDEAGVETRACGEHTCSEGNECCNASCGICTAPGNLCIQIACRPATPETCKTVLCGPKDLCMETPAGAVCVPEVENPCNLVDCQPNSTCKVEQGAPVCVPLGGGNGDAGAPIVKKDAGSTTAIDAGSTSSDASQPAKDAGSSAMLDAGSQLDAGTPREDAGSPTLDAGTKKDSGVVVPSTCATVLCPTGTYCDDISGSPECLPLPSCNTVKCSAGHHCQLEQVVCVRAPCPPQPTCVPDKDPTDPCDALKCKVGTHCQVTPITCITTPCNPIATCVPDKGGCGCTGKGACLDVAAVGGVDIVCPIIDPVY